MEKREEIDKENQINPDTQNEHSITHKNNKVEQPKPDQLGEKKSSINEQLQPSEDVFELPLIRGI